MPGIHAAHLKHTIARRARKAAQEGLGLSLVLDDVAAYLQAARQRNGGRLGVVDEDGDWAADLAIDIYEGREPSAKQTRDCAGCGRPFTPKAGSQIRCHRSCKGPKGRR